MKKYIILYSLLLAFQTVAQTSAENSTIYRDVYGVPHIHGKTDRDVAYGLAWAHAEDDFKTMQNTFYALLSLCQSIKIWILLLLMKYKCVLIMKEVIFLQIGCLIKGEIN